MWFKKNKWKVIIPVAAVAVMAAAFYFGGNAPGSKGWSVASGDTTNRTAAVTETEGVSDTPDPGTPQTSSAQTDTAGETTVPESSETSAQTDTTAETTVQESSETSAPAETPAPESQTRAADTTSKPAKTAPEGYAWRDGMLINTKTGKDQYQTDPVPEGKPLPVEPQDVVTDSTAYTCTLSISCSTILNNINLCDPEKVELVPEDGWILKPTQVTFYGGESVFNVLLRTCKQLKIHMEFENTPIYNSAYIKGIGNLYEFDVGELSGWMFKVNDWFPNYGCSRYQLKNGDTVEWVYTCNLGVDVGGNNSTGG